MSSSLSWKEWALIVIVNVLVSALTTWIVVRLLTSQPRPLINDAPRAVAAGPAAAVAPAQAAAIPAAAPTAQLIAAPTPTAAAKPSALPVAAPTAAPTAAPASSTAAAAQPTGVRVASVTFAGQRQREFVALVNEGDTQSLQGWTLQSSRGVSYTLPNVTVFKDGFLNIYTTSGTNSATEVFIGRTEAAWQPGDSITLASREGQPVSRFDVR